MDQRIQYRQDYVYFRACCAQQHVVLGGCRKWSFFDHGHKTKSLIPLICIPGVSCTSEIFFIVITTLGSCGFRVIAVDYPPASTFREWAVNLAEFMDFLDIPKCHLFGCNLGGLMSMWFAKIFPAKAASLILCNSFTSASYLHMKIRWARWLHILPTNLLRSFALRRLPTYVQDVNIAKALEFVIFKVDDLSREDLISRLLLHSDCSDVGAIETMQQENVTVIFCLDKTRLPARVIAQQLERFPNARKAFLKSGGDFPSLSRPEEIILHLRIHLSQFDQTYINERVCRSSFDSTPPRMSRCLPESSESAHMSLMFTPPLPHPRIAQEDNLARGLGRRHSRILSSTSSNLCKSKVKACETVKGATLVPQISDSPILEKDLLRQSTRPPRRRVPDSVKILRKRLLREALSDPSRPRSILESDEDF